MNKNLHIGTLVAALTAGCAANPGIKDGEYFVGTPKMPAAYFVQKNATSCGLTLNPKILYIDLDCDNTLDFIYLNYGHVLSREKLSERTADLSVFDEALKLGQMRVCKENRIKHLGK